MNRQASPSRKEALIAQLQAMDEALTRKAEASLEAFVEQAWEVIEPGTPLVRTWHLGAICRHLEAVLARQIRMLLILVPPRSGKSTCTSVCLTPWAWIRTPGLRFMFASYGAALSLELAVKSRRLIEGAWYTDRWGSRYRLTTDQNVKAAYENTQRGMRISTSIEGGVTGRGGDVLVIDDPHNMEQIHSEAERYRVRESFYRRSWHSRVNDETTAGRICIMQRGHPDDLAAYLMEIGYEALVLPNEYDPKRSTVTSIGWRDPRTEPGQLLCPDRISAETTAQLKRVGMGMYQSQYQQEPLPEEGRMFKVDRIVIETAIPVGVRQWVRFWDVAGTEGGAGARTAGVKMGRDATGRFVIADIRKGRWSEQGVEREMTQTARLDGQAVAIREEQEPGSSGKAVIAARARSLAGYDYRGVPVTGDKVTRARPLASQVEAGNVILIIPASPVPAAAVPVANRVSVSGAVETLGGTDAREFLDELRDFPHGLKDQVDAASGAFNVLVGGASRPMDIVGGITAPSPAQEAAEASAYLSERGYDPGEADAADTTGIEDLLS